MDDRSRVRIVALVVAGTAFMAQLDAAVLATALPRMAVAFHVPTVRLSLAITTYMFAFVALLPASSWVADRFGTRTVFLVAISVFAIGSLLCSLSTSYLPFIGARIFQGVGAALMTPVGRLVVIRSAPKRDLVSVLTFISTPMLFALTFGPAIGGFFVTYFTWPWIFLLNLPIAAFAIAATLRFVPNVRDETTPPLDIKGLLLVSGAILALLGGIDQLGLGKWRIAGALLAGGTAISALTLHHLKHYPRAIISLTPLAKPTFTIPSLTGGALARLPMRAVTFLLPLLFQLVLGMNALAAGSLVLALSAGDLVLKPLARQCFERFGYRTTLCSTAFVGVATALGCAAFYPGVWIPLIVAVLVISGMARSLLFTGLTSLAFLDLHDSEIGAGNVIVSLMQQTTSALGVSISALALHTSMSLRGHTTPGMFDFQMAFVVIAVLGLWGAILLLRLNPEAGAHASEGAHSSKVVATSEKQPLPSTTA